jgi:nicotinamidase/pyrazinamidase
MKTIIVVVDVQKDFYHPDGALYVKGAEVLPSKIAEVIPHFDDVVFTVDWHPQTHCSFAYNGGNWPIHCVAFTEGASLPTEFIPFLKDIHDDRCYNVVAKGMDTDKEEYGADANAIMTAHDENPEECEFVFCGIAGDYCVKETINNFITKFPNAKVSVLTECVASIDDGSTLRKYMDEHNIPVCLITTFLHELYK